MRAATMNSSRTAHCASGRACARASVKNSGKSFRDGDASHCWGFYGMVRSIFRRVALDFERIEDCAFRDATALGIYVEPFTRKIPRRHDARFHRFLLRNSERARFITRLRSLLSPALCRSRIANPDRAIVKPLMVFFLRQPRGSARNFRRLSRHY